jgi:hypothetical protein
VRCPCGLLTHSGARGGVGLPPGPLRGPARSWLTTVGSIPNAGDRGLSTALGRGEIEPQRDKGSRRDIYGESGAGAGNLRDWRAERRPRGPYRPRTKLALLRGTLPHPEEGRRPVSKDRGAIDANSGRSRVAARRTHAFDHPLTRLAAKRQATLSHEGRGVGIRCTVTAPSPLVGEGFPPRSCARSCASRMAGRVRGENARGMNPTLACWAHPYGLEAARQQPFRRPLSP